MGYEHVIYTGDHHSAESIAEWAQQRSGVVVDDPAPARRDPRTWVVRAYTAGYEDERELERQRAWLRRLAITFGGEYDGEGTYVGPHAEFLPEQLPVSTSAWDRFLR